MTVEMVTCVMIENPRLDALLAAPKEKLSSVYYVHSPLFDAYSRYGEIFILWSGDESTWEVSCF